jgi:hypothetical protein
MSDLPGGDHPADVNCCCSACTRYYTHQVFGVDLYFARRRESDHVFQRVHDCVEADAAGSSPGGGRPFVYLYGRNHLVPVTVSGRVRYRFFVIVEAGSVSQGIHQKLASALCHVSETREMRGFAQKTVEESWPEVDVEVDFFPWSRTGGWEMWSLCLSYLDTMDNLMSSGCVLGSRQRVLFCVCRKLGLHSSLDCSLCSDMRHFRAMMLSDT